MLQKALIFGILWLSSYPFGAAESHGFVNPRPERKIETGSSPRLAREVSSYRQQSNDLYPRDETFNSAKVALDIMWKDSPLVKIGFETENELSSTKEDDALGVGFDIDVHCIYCYITGEASAQLEVNGTTDLGNYTAKVLRQAGSVVSQIIDDFEDAHLEDLDNIEFTMAFSDIPRPRLRAQLDHLELYMEMITKLHAMSTYTLNLYTSQTVAGITLSEDNEIGVIFTIDLILSAEADITLSNGFHLKMDDSITIDIDMFGNEITNIDIPGGDFEFLPVMAQNTSLDLKATLRVGVHAGIAAYAPKLEVGVGVEAGIYAHIAELESHFVGGTDLCDVQVENQFAVALGAAAGATAVWLGTTWGPTLDKSTKVFYTTADPLCIDVGSASLPLPPTGTIKARDLTTTTLTTVVEQTIIACQSPGLLDCPNSLRNRTEYDVTRTLTAVVSAEDDATLTPLPVITPATFGAGVRKLPTLETPTSWVPRPSDDSSTSEPGSGSSNQSLSKQNRSMIIGITVGVGVPVVLAVIVLSLWLLRRRRRGLAQMSPATAIGETVVATSQQEQQYFHKPATLFKTGHDAKNAAATTTITAISSAKR